jgi:hypothetical protein
MNWKALIISVISVILLIEIEKLAHIEISDVFAFIQGGILGGVACILFPMNNKQYNK